jgi:hypothetical protein
LIFCYAFGRVESCLKETCEARQLKAMKN